MSIYPLVPWDSLAIPTVRSPVVENHHPFHEAIAITFTEWVRRSAPLITHSTLQSDLSGFSQSY
ncbi:hypothetical protein NWP22_05255 [Anabaenopsis tanganyikae CS-531]|uniref:Uncharacterized protein n=1 Tax=Anabaenopsis tanganyikae CS-531 TaxID=2785304 RepID=A0ABT6KBQ5_9CYAN|nr:MULTISPECIES: hypothetical protein [Anabaenopsis]MDH6093279.1 hypothetical protein [Anabaenopsis arnoldii]MDH6105282.1 hypothetical protein [Anabaenopsis tanganyikae CS-531]